MQLVKLHNFSIPQKLTQMILQSVQHEEQHEKDSKWSIFVQKTWFHKITKKSSRLDVNCGKTEKKKPNTVWRHLNGFGFLGAKIQETVILIADRSDPVVSNVDVKLQNWCCLIQSAAKIIHIITHECKWARWNHKSLGFPIVLYLWKVYSTKKKKEKKRSYGSILFSIQNHVNYNK